MLKQVQLRLVAEETGFIDGEVFDQTRQLLLPRLADEQAIVAVERIQLALLQPALQTVLKKRMAPIVEMHAARMVDQRLQEFQFSFGECGYFACACAHWIRLCWLLSGRGSLRSWSCSCFCPCPCPSPHLASAGRRRTVSKLGCRQYLADVEQNDQPSLVLAQAGHTVQSAGLHHGGPALRSAFRAP